MRAIVNIDNKPQSGIRGWLRTPVARVLVPALFVSSLPAFAQGTFNCSGVSGTALLDCQLINQLGSSTPNNSSSASSPGSSTKTVALAAVGGVAATALVIYLIKRHHHAEQAHAMLNTPHTESNSDSGRTARVATNGDENRSLLASNSVPLAFSRTYAGDGVLGGQGLLAASAFPSAFSAAIPSSRLPMALSPPIANSNAPAQQASQLTSHKGYWSKRRIVLLAAGLGVTAAGAFLWANGKDLQNANYNPAACQASFNSGPIPYNPNACNQTLPGGSKKAGLWMMVGGGSLSGVSFVPGL